MTSTTLLLMVSGLLFSIGLVGVIIRRHLLIMLMFLELMLNGVVLSLVVFTQLLAAEAGITLVFLVFVVAAAEVAIAIPIVLLLVRSGGSLDPSVYSGLKG